MEKSAEGHQLHFGGSERPGLERVAHFIKAAAIMAQVDPVEYGLLEYRNGGVELAPQPAEQWVTHLADMNWPYAMGGAHL